MKAAYEFMIQKGKRSKDGWIANADFMTTLVSLRFYYERSQEELTMA